MNFRERYGLSPKARHSCPVCGVEVKPRQTCKNHADSARGRRRRAYNLHRFLCAAVDEARAQP